MNEYGTDGEVRVTNLSSDRQNKNATKWPNLQERDKNVSLNVTE